LKQAGREWYKKLSGSFYELGYTRSTVDHSIFFVRSRDAVIVVAVATDDMAVAGTPLRAVEDFKRKLATHFAISDMGELQWFLGFEVKRDRAGKTISINQKAYMQAMANKFGVQDAKPVNLPALPGQILDKEQSPTTPSQQLLMRGIPYAEAIGHVLWPAMVSRPDVVFQVGILLQFVQNPGKAHWEALKRVVTYLNTTRDLWLTVGGDGEPEPIVYTDADWASQSDRHSVSGYAMIMGVGAVTWSSKKQAIIALSSTELEYIGQTHSLKEILWVRQFLGELVAKFVSPTPLLSDNQSAIALAKNNKFHARSKHIDIRYHFIREAVENEIVKLSYVPTGDNTADIFTKPLAAPKFTAFRNALGLRPAAQA
jgi:hypothetical protein